MLRKVPQITALFWVIKLLTTAMGESTSDFLVFHFNPYAAVIAGFVVFAVVLWLQFKANQLYSLAILADGTDGSDLWDYGGRRYTRCTRRTVPRNYGDVCRSTRRHILFVAGD